MRAEYRLHTVLKRWCALTQQEGHERADGLEAALTQTKEERDALQVCAAT